MSESRAIVGGVDYAVGGWGSYEADCRRARWEAQQEYVGGGDNGALKNVEAFRPKQNYPNRSYIGTDDATYSLYDASRNRPNALTAAATNFAKVLTDYETAIIDKIKHGSADSVTLLPITSSQIWSITTDETLGVDEEAMDEITNLLNKIMRFSTTTIIKSIKKDHLPKMVSVDDDKAVLDLEQSVVSRLEMLEQRQAQLATLLEKCAKVLENDV